LTYSERQESGDENQHGTTEAAWRICPATAEDAERPQIQPQWEGTAAATPALDLLRRAQSLQATDIHIDPTASDRYSVRLRIDGRMERYCDLDNDLATHLLQQGRHRAGHRSHRGG
jgi:type II secretory ATPase GspE/PulE/Tfp pilus assembly ATPase PilB-like protein